MAVRVCSLIREVEQTILNDGEYHVVRFPFQGESDDPWGMHDTVQPDGAVVDCPGWDGDDRSGLIWPASFGWGSLTAMVYWEPAGYSEVRSRFVRDPLNLTTGYDSTATVDQPDTAGGEYKHYCHEMYVHSGTPVALLVRHGGTGAPRKITHAQFKLAIHPVDLPPAQRR